MVTPAGIPSIAQLVRSLLDDGFEAAARGVLEAIASGSQYGLLDRRLKQFDEEAARLAAAGDKMTADNAVLASVLGEFQQSLVDNTVMLRRLAFRMQEEGIAAAERLTPRLAFAGLDVPALGYQWNQPDPQAIAEIVDLTTSKAWDAELVKYRANAASVARNTAIRHIVAGASPIKVATELRRVISGFPVSEARNLARTLQLTSYRRAAAAHQLANEDILEAQIRVAVLDERTCMSCVSLHGTRMKVGEVVLDHHQGRCGPLPIVIGRKITIQSGESWFRQQPEMRQRQMMGHEAFDLWQQERIALEDFVQPYQDDLFGEMIREKSLKQILAN